MFEHRARTKEGLLCCYLEFTCVCLPCFWFDLELITATLFSLSFLFSVLLLLLSSFDAVCVCTWNLTCPKKKSANTENCSARQPRCGCWCDCLSSDIVPPFTPRGLLSRRHCCSLSGQRQTGPHHSSPPSEEAIPVLCSSTLVGYRPMKGRLGHVTSSALKRPGFSVFANFFCHL